MSPLETCFDTGRVGPLRLEMQPTFSGGIGEGFDSAMESVMSAVKHDLSDAFFFGSFGEFHPDPLGCLGVTAVVDFPLGLLGYRACGGQGVSVQIINDLSIDVFATPEDGQTWTFWSAKQLSPHVSSSSELLLLFRLVLIHGFVFVGGLSL